MNILPLIYMIFRVSVVGFLFFVSSAAFSGLSYITLNINGVDKVISNFKNITFVKGDILKIKSAYLSKGKEVSHVNFVGFPNKDSVSPENDFNYEIHTDKDLLVGWSKNKEGRVYFLKFFDEKNLVSTVPVYFKEPELLYVLAKINDKQITLRPNEIRTVKKEDKIQILRIKSNLTEIDDSIRFNMKKEDSDNYYSMNFFRNTKIFGKIKIKISP